MAKHYDTSNMTTERKRQLRERTSDLNRTITKDEFEETIARFEDLEPSRWQLYRMGLHLLGLGFEVEGYLLILATWNFARFRYVMRTFKLDRFRETIEATRPHFQRLDGERFQDANFDAIAHDVSEIYVRFKLLVDQTGASKIMHFKHPRLFVMWDTEIRKRYRIPNQGSAEDFLRFQKLMQSRFAHLAWTHTEKTLPKAIDEFNFVWVHGRQTQGEFA